MPGLLYVGWLVWQQAVLAFWMPPRKEDDE